MSKRTSPNKRVCPAPCDARRGFYHTTVSMLRYAMLCYAMLVYALPCQASPCHATPHHYMTALCKAMLRRPVVCCALLYYAL